MEMVWPEGKQPSEGEIQMALPGKRGLAGRHHFDEFLPGERGPNYRFSERGEGRPWKTGGVSVFCFGCWCVFFCLGGLLKGVRLDGGFAEVLFFFGMGFSS